MILPEISPAAGGPSASIPVEPRRSYTEGVLGEATNASPFGAHSQADRILVSLLFRGLVRLGPGDSVVPDLAESWEIDATGAAWTFHLRPGETWQDGVPITADDVVFTYRVLADPEYTGPGAGDFSDVSATAVDPLTVRLTLKTPLGGFLQAATRAIAPAHVLGDVATADLPAQAFGRHPIGSGAFSLSTLDSSGALLVPWQPAAGEGGPGASPLATSGLPLPYLDGIDLRFYSDPAALAADFAAGTLDAASGLPPGTEAALTARHGSRLLSYPGTMLVTALFNLRTTHPEFRDANVRRALLAAIDRDAIVSGPLAGLAQRADAPIPPTSWAFDAKASAPVAFDPAAAAAGLKAAGWTRSSSGWTPKGATSPIKLEIIGPDRETAESTWAVAEAIATDWRAIGLDVTHTAISSTVIAQRLKSGDFGVAVLTINVGLDPDLYPLMASSQTTSTRSNVMGLQDLQLDKLLSAARAPGTTDQRLAAYAALQARLAEQQYLLPLAFRSEAVVVSDAVEGPVTRPVSGSWDRFWDVLTWRLADGR